MRALLVDDELPALAELAYLLRLDARITEVTPVGSGAEALSALAHQPFDVVFCDINMPGLSGMDVARTLARMPSPPSLVFITAHEQHAVDAFEVRALDYVLKPVRAERLSEAVRRVVGARAAESASPTTAPEPEDETIAVELGGVTTFVRRSQVIYAQAQGDYARLHTDDGAHLVRVSLTLLEERWQEAGFARIHRSTLVNLARVTHVRVHQGHCSVLLDDVELQVSRRHTRALRDRLGRTGLAPAGRRRGEL